MTWLSLIASVIKLLTHLTQTLADRRAISAAEAQLTLAQLRETNERLTLALDIRRSVAALHRAGRLPDHDPYRRD